MDALVSGCAYGPRLRTLGLIRSREPSREPFREATATIAFSRYVAGLAQRNGVAAEKFSVVTPALEDSAFADDVATRPPENAILFAGRVVPSKGRDRWSARWLR